MPDDLSDLLRKPPDVSDMLRHPPNLEAEGWAYDPNLTLSKTWHKNVHDLYRDAGEMISAPGVGWKLWGAAKTFGDLWSLPFTPIEYGIAETAGRVVSTATGGRIKPETVGEIGVLAPMFFFDPVGLIGAGARATRASKLGQAVEKGLSPTTVGPEATRTGELLQARGGEEAAREFRAQEMLRRWQGELNVMQRADRASVWGAGGVFDNIERGLPQANPRLQEFADAHRAIQDQYTALIRGAARVAGKNVLAKDIQNYLRRNWLQPGKTAEEVLKEQLEAMGSHSSLTQAANFLKPRTHEWMVDALAAGMRPLVDDPVEWVLLGLRQQNMWATGVLKINDLKTSGMMRFKAWWDKLRPGEKLLQDTKSFRAVLPPEEVTFRALHETTFDPSLRAGMERIAHFLGFKISTPLRSQDPLLAQTGWLGYASSGGDVVSRFANDVAVMEHEVGHQIEYKAGLANFLAHGQPGQVQGATVATDRQVWRELGHLALMRQGALQPAQITAASGLLDRVYRGRGNNFIHHLLNSDERIANFFAAYWHAPELLQQVAPTALAKFETWMATEGSRMVSGSDNLSDLIRSVRPSLRLEQQSIAQDFSKFVPGWRIMGDWVAHEDVTRVVDNYLSRGFRGNALYDASRVAGNFLNMAQLGISGFHATFVSVDGISSEVARSIEQITHGEFGRAAMTALTSPAAPVSLTRAGSRLRSWLIMPRHMRTADQQMFVNAYTKSGARARMDVMYRITNTGLFHSWQRGTFMREVSDLFKDHPLAGAFKLPFWIAGKVLQDISAPIMEWYVPRMKMGVQMRLMEDALRRNPGMSEADLLHTMQEIQASIDNRLGQMVYDNLFATRSLKDIAFLASRAPGWNLGTLRELVGGGTDWMRYVGRITSGRDAEFTHRMAYVVAMPVVTASMGAMLTYLFTGRGPNTTYDYFFPPTNTLTPHGNPERVILPSYMKDVFAYNREPARTLVSKLHPALETIMEIYSNRDYYGGAIVPPDQDLATHMSWMLEYLAGQVMPFSVRSANRLRKEGADIRKQIASFAGLQAAPAWVTEPERGEAWQYRADIRAMRRRLREQ
jgi:hypothetical protein